MYSCLREKNIKLPSYGEVMEKVKAELLRLVGEKVVEFEEEFVHWFGKGTGMPRASSLCPQCAESPGFERRGKRQRCFYPRYGKVESALLQVTCRRCGCTFSPFSERGKQYSRDLVLSALTVSYHAAAITVWQELRGA